MEISQILYNICQGEQRSRPLDLFSLAYILKYELISNLKLKEHFYININLIAELCNSDMHSFNLTITMVQI